MTSSQDSRARYLTQVLGACLGLMGWLGLSQALPLAIPEAAAPQWLGLAVLALPLVALPFLLYRNYRRRDELRRVMHQRACVFALHAGAPLLALAGLGQSFGLLPTPPWSWAFVLLAACWALGLSLTERSLH